MALFGVSSVDSSSARFPYGTGFKIRSGIGTPDRSFYWEDGGRNALFHASIEGSATAFICEGETDTMRLKQELPALDVYGLSGIDSWKTGFAMGFATYEHVFVILDNDVDYAVQGRVDTAWRKIRLDLGPKAKRIVLPQGVKDVCEYFQKGYDADDLRELIATPVSHYTPLDLSDASIRRPVNWHVEGLFGCGDLVLAFGDPGVGKSWLSMSLAVATVQGHERWLGLPLLRHGKVLYVDQENPEDIVIDRLYKLGITDEDLPNIRVLHEQGIRVDRDPSKLLDEIIAFDPVLVVLDSLRRIQTKDENSAGEMSAVFNDALKPLSRETGATVFLIHHANKSREGGSFTRQSGSGDITANADAGLDVRGLTPGYISVAHYKSRRVLPRPPIGVQIQDQENGRVKLVPTTTPF